jgi:putative transposase
MTMPWLNRSSVSSRTSARTHRTEYPTREHGRRDIARYIELHYNTKRRHSALGYRTPQQVHDEYLEKQLAA